MVALRLSFLSIVVFSVVGCAASAKVKHTTPVANLQTYTVVGVRGAEGSINPQLTQQLVDDTVLALSQQCQFQQVLPADRMGNATPDLLIDLNLRQATRGGTGFVQNENKANVEVLVILSDGSTQDLLGTAWIDGESAAVANGAQTPEQQAIGAVAGELAKVLAKSGCVGPRVARVAEPPPPATATTVAATDPAAPPTGTPPADGTPTGTPAGTPPPATDNRARADALNDEGKKLFVSAELEAALAKFREAKTLHSDARYDFNICLALEAQKKYDDAIAACQVVAQGSDARLATKAKDRITIIQGLKGKEK